MGNIDPRAAWLQWASALHAAINARRPFSWLRNPYIQHEPLRAFRSGRM